MQTVDFSPTKSVEPVALATMKAAVYKGDSVVEVESIPVPEIGAGEVLIRVEACGICHTDLKKIEYNLLPAPRIYGHETAGVVAKVGRGVTKFQPGDGVIVFHHIPCGKCFYCSRKLYAQCPVYKKVGVTAGYEPAGGGFSQYVRAMDWIVERGVEKIPAGVSFDQACFVEPVNTCLKGVKQIDPQPEDVVAILGQGPIGLIFTMMVARIGSKIVATDTMPARRKLSREFGALESYDPRGEDLELAVRLDDRRARSRPGHRGRLRQGNRRAGGEMLAAGGEDSAVRANVTSGARGPFRCRYLHGGAHVMRFLQRFDRRAGGGRGDGVRRFATGRTAYFSSVYIKSY